MTPSYFEMCAVILSIASNLMENGLCSNDTWTSWCLQSQQSRTICSTTCLDYQNIKHQRSTFLTLWKMNHRWPTNCPYERKLMRKVFPCHVQMYKPFFCKYHPLWDKAKTENIWSDCFTWYILLVQFALSSALFSWSKSRKGDFFNRPLGPYS